MKRALGPIIAALIGATCLGAGQAQAARTLLADMLARPPVADRPVMSALALEACLARAKELDRTGVAVDMQVVAIDRLAAEGLLLQNQINAELPVLGDFDEKGLNDFQQRVIRREQLARQFKTEFPVYQQAQKDYDAAVAEFERNCAGGFSASDLAAAKTKLGIK